MKINIAILNKINNMTNKLMNQPLIQSCSLMHSLEVDTQYIIQANKLSDFTTEQECVVLQIKSFFSNKSTLSYIKFLFKKKLSRSGHGIAFISENI